MADSHAGREFVCSNLVAFFQHILKGYNLVQHAIATAF